MAAAKKTPKKPAPARKQGRPSVFSKAVADGICQRISKGQSLRAICEDKGMPSLMTVMRWLKDDREGFREQYASAREEQADFYASECVEIADEAEVVTKMDGEEVRLVLDPTAVARNRLRVDARKWYASKLAPKKYGDRTTVAGDAENPLVVNGNLSTMSEQALMAIAQGARAA